MVPALDISQYQGAWQDRGDPIVMIKMSGGDAGLYMDSRAAENYDGAVKAGRAVGGYHFAGWTNPTAESTYFMQAMSPLAENDVYALDAEAIPAGVDPVAWSLTFVNNIHDKIGVWPLVYMNLSTLNAHDWTPVLQNCGLWLADWNNDPSGTIPTLHTYVMQQYSDGPNYDHDEWFGTVEEFKAYGYHAANDPSKVTLTPPSPVTPPAPEPPTPPSPPAGTVDTQPTPQPVEQPPVQPTPKPVPPTPNPAPKSPVKPVVHPPVMGAIYQPWYVRLWNWLKKDI